LVVPTGSRATLCSVEAQLQDASTDKRRSSFAFLEDGGSTGCPTISDQTDVGVSSALPLALASSVFPMLRPLTRLAVRSARSRGRAGLAAFPCSANFTGWFRFALCTGSALVRVGPFRRTRAWLLAFWLKPFSLFGLLGVTVLTSIHLVLTLSSDSSAPPA